MRLILLGFLLLSPAFRVGQSTESKHPAFAADYRCGTQPHRRRAAAKIGKATGTVDR